MPDAHANFAYSTVATAPSPATSGTSLVVAAGDGAKFPAVPFNATICPASTQPTTTNAEIVRVTARSTDTLTITRAQESTSARTVVVGDQIFASITAQTLVDAEVAAASSLRDAYLRPSTITYETMPRGSQINSASAISSGVLTLCAVALPKGAVISNITFVSSTTAAGTPTHWWFGLYDSSRVQLATTADQTTTAWAASTAKTLSIATIASGAASSFTTTYEGLYYLGLLVTATSTPTLPVCAIAAGIGALTPLLSGSSTNALTTPPAFPFTAGAILGGSSQIYAGAA